MGMGFVNSFASYGRARCQIIADKRSLDRTNAAR
jgi:hypothetical protein